jgi:hypothetical protein
MLCLGHEGRTTLVRLTRCIVGGWRNVSSAFDTHMLQRRFLWGTADSD